MITRTMIAEMIAAMSSDPAREGLITGLMMGCNMAVKNLERAKQLDKDLQAEWKLSIDSPGGNYGPGELTDMLLRGFDRALGEGGNGIH